MKKIFVKTAILAVLTMGTVFLANFEVVNASSQSKACPYNDPHQCCVYYCMHDPTCPAGACNDF